MFGAVTPAGVDAVLPVTVVNASRGREARVEAIVDTGFTGHLTLRPQTVERLSLPVAGSTEAVLADGSTVIGDFCFAWVVWHDRPRPARVLIADAIPLLGMSLLRGSELRVEAKPGGAVVVRPLP